MTYISAVILNGNIHAWVAVGESGVASVVIKPGDPDFQLVKTKFNL